MWILGLSGGPDPIYPSADLKKDPRFVRRLGFRHDSAAVLLKDGVVISAVEEERLNRIKHTSKFPARAIQSCLQAGNISLTSVDRIAYSTSEKGVNELVSRYVSKNAGLNGPATGRAFVAGLFRRDFGAAISATRIDFVEHHLAHAASTFYMSSLREALVVTLDGEGDAIAGTISIGSGQELTRIAEIPVQNSLGLLYLEFTQLLGYKFGDEYKVMGLASYGNPSRYRSALEGICILLPDGIVEIDRRRIKAFEAVFERRQNDEPLTQAHMDLAAAVQEALERAVFHILSHYRAQTGQRNLCLAGGVALNSTMTGKLLRSGMFASVFVQPASHDAGCALGSALIAHQTCAPNVPIQRSPHVYWGTDAKTGPDLEKRVRMWSELITFSQTNDAAGEAARLLAGEAILGWVQGKSEFGPRALGNRSILADARPASNKDVINRAIKMREWYRPFAPAVLEEFADAYFEMPSNSCADYMTFVVPVRMCRRELLGAVTHVDGTARVQTVSRAANLPFWQLIEAFRGITGVPVVLNTSFNLNAEPIVDSVHDAIACFLTSSLTHLIVGDFVIAKKTVEPQTSECMYPCLPQHVRLVHTHQADRTGKVREFYWCENTSPEQAQIRPISAETYHVLAIADGSRSVHKILVSRNVTGKDALYTELQHLWTERLIHLRPAEMAKIMLGAEGGM